MSGIWRIDDVTIHKIVEIESAYTTIDRFFPGITPDTLREHLSWFKNDGYVESTRQLFLSYHSFIVETPRYTILIDSCVGNNKSCPVRDTWHNKSDTRWLDEFAATGLQFEDIDFVLCSHLHVDHVGWNTRMQDGNWVPTFPNARYLMVDKEYDYASRWAREHQEDTAMAALFQAVFEESIQPVVDAGCVDFVSATHVLDPYVRLLPTPGHTPAHVAICVGRHADSAVFTGDLIHSPIQTRLPDLKVRLDDDPELALQSRRAFFERFADTKTLVFTMHFPAPSVGYLRREGRAYVLDYQGPDEGG